MFHHDEADVRSFRMFSSQMMDGGTVKPRHSSASVLKGEVIGQAQRLLAEGQSVPEVAQELGVLANTLHKVISAGRLRSSKKTRTALPR